MNPIKYAIKNQIEQKDKINGYNLTATILAYDYQCNTATIRYNNPNGDGSILKYNVPVATTNGGCINTSAFKSGKKCYINFLNGNINNPIILGILDGDLFSFKSNTDQGATIIDSDILSTDTFEITKGMIGDWIDESNTDEDKYNSKFGDYINYDYITDIYMTSKTINRYEEDEIGIINLTNNSSLKINNDGSINIFTKNNTGIKIGNNGEIFLYGNDIKINNQNLVSVIDKRIKKLANSSVIEEKNINVLDVTKPTVTTTTKPVTNTNTTTQTTTNQNTSTESTSIMVSLESSMDKTITIGSSNIPFYLYVPKGASSTTPIILACHGKGSSSGEEMRGSGKGTFTMYTSVYNGSVSPRAIIIYPTKGSGSWNGTALSQLLRDFKDRNGLTGAVHYYGFSIGSMNGPDIIKSYGKFIGAVLVDCPYITMGSDKTASPTYAKLSCLKGLKFFGGCNYDSVAERNSLKMLFNSDGKIYEEDMPGYGHASMNSYSVNPGLSFLLSLNIS